MKLSGYSRKEIKQQLKIPGSKFHRDFASDPMKLWAIIQDMISAGQCRAWYSLNKKIFSFEFDKDKQPAGIGTNGIVEFSALTDKERNNVKKEVREGYTIQTISGIESGLTWEMHMVIMLSEEPIIATIFPGTYTPSFPDSKTQSSEEYHDSEEFWKTHALIR